MRNRTFSKRIVGTAIGVFAALAIAAVAQAPRGDAFRQFRTDQINEFKEYAGKLRQDKVPPEEYRAKLKEYSKGMLERAEKFRDSDKGKPYVAEANEFIMEIAIQVANDPEAAKKVIAAETDAEKAGELQLRLAEMVASSNPKEAKRLIEDVIKSSKGKDSGLHAKAQKALFKVAPEGLVFPDFAEGAKDIEGKPIKIADYKGKVVLVDFWAAWCGPCIREAPNVVKAYKKYNPKGFEIIGISLDQEKEKMLAATKEHGMTWRQYFDGKGWKNEVSTAYGVNSIPAMYLVGPDGKVISNNIRGPKLESAIEKALEKK